MRLESVRYQYAGAGVWALDGVDLDVRRGEVVGLVGANDAGKSTVCLVAATLAPAVTGGRLEGRVWLVDGGTTALPAHEAARRCGVLFQNPLAQLSGTAGTVWEEIAFGPRNLSLELGLIADRVERSLAILRIGHLAPRDPGRLSGGQAQLVALASVLALAPRALVLDEPTSQLDPEGTRLVGEAIRRVADETGCGVLIVEHKTSLLAAITDRVAVLSAGRTVVAGATDAILGDAGLPELGIDPPHAVRIRRAITAAGLPEAATSKAAEAIAAVAPLRDR